MIQPFFTVRQVKRAQVDPLQSSAGSIRTFSIRKTSMNQKDQRDDLKNEDQEAKQNETQAKNTSEIKSEDREEGMSS